MALLSRKHEQQKWDPFSELREMSDRLNRVFAPEPFAFLARRGEENQPLANIDWAPHANISETENAYLIRADLPEVQKEDVKVCIDNGLLTIEGERKQERKEENERYHRVESSYGRFLRRFSLPDDADEGNVEGTFKDGTLTVRITKNPDKGKKARQIKVN
jgi:HSP20 family protein